MAGRARLSIEDLNADPNIDSLRPHQEDARDAARARRPAWEREGSTLSGLSIIALPRMAWLRVAAVRSTGYVKLLPATWITLQPLGRWLRVAAVRRTSVTTRGFVRVGAHSNRFAPPRGSVVLLNSRFRSIAQVSSRRSSSRMPPAFGAFRAPCCRSALVGDSNLPKDSVARSYPNAALDRPPSQSAVLMARGCRCNTATDEIVLEQQRRCRL